MQSWVVICWAVLVLVGADECPDGGRCKEGQTCCSSPTSDGYKCCPFDQAECCEDHIHCCPAGTVCNAATSSCVNATVSVPWAERISADHTKNFKSFRMIKTSMDKDYDTICADKSRCPAEFSCVKGLTKFGCCPVAKGVSCSDGKHCCPEGHHCSIDSRSCIKKAEVPCNETAACRNGTTCCKTKKGEWTCCPFEKAVCCKDGKHCCQHGKKCNPEKKMCEDDTTSVPWAEKIPTIPREDVQLEMKNVPCDGTTKCPDETTCCKNKTGGWFCCSIPNAVCCNDSFHCCPHGRKCNLVAMTCDAGIFSEPMAKKIPSIPRQDVQVEAKVVPCNSTAACPDGSTCCKTQQGGWACCPLPEAVCCEDFIHCCPNGEKCNLAAMTCDDGLFSQPLVKKIPTIPRQDVQVEAKVVPCNSTVGCPDGSTCCKTQQGGWACCPLPEAVCCEDFIHCCPNGETCNLAAMTCDDGPFSQPLIKKIPTIPRQDVQVEAKVVPCNSTAGCPDGSTCCKTQQGGWACCPLPRAVCCADHKHCCPAGSKCDLSTFTCRKASGSTPMMQKTPVFTFEVDNAEETPTQTQLTEEPVRSEELSAFAFMEGNYVKDYDDNDDDDDSDDDDDDDDNDSDDEYDGEEEDGGEEIPDMKNRTKCDNHTSCPHRTTCCFITSSKKWGCCPMRKAVCCSDGVHCCPAHHKCKEDKASCTRDGVVIPWYTKIPATTSDQTDPSSVKCDNTTKCPRHTSCCKMSRDKWGCCPVKRAVCCHDKKHCCPRGYNCDLNSKSCKKEGLLETVPLTPVQLPENQLQLDLLQLQQETVKCDDQYTCPDGKTCCHLSPTTWGCCPIPNAVCCSDFIHCCPSGTTCSGGSCVQNETPNWYNWKSSFANKKKAQIL